MIFGWYRRVVGEYGFVGGFKFVRVGRAVVVTLR